MRLQILELPSRVIGDDVTTPFILVASEVTQPVSTAAELDGIRAEYGRMREIPDCEYVFVSNQPVEIGPA